MTGEIMGSDIAATPICMAICTLADDKRFPKREVAALAAGARNATSGHATAAYFDGLGRISNSFPAEIFDLAVGIARQADAHTRFCAQRLITAIVRTQGGKPDADAGALAQRGATLLLSQLENETSSRNRQHLVDNIMTCAKYGAEMDKIKTGLEKVRAALAKDASDIETAKKIAKITPHV